jgi:hypothetical protein
MPSATAKIGAWAKKLSSLISRTQPVSLTPVTVTVTMRFAEAIVDSRAITPSA